MGKEWRHIAKSMNLIVSQENFVDKNPDDFIYASLTQPPIKVLDKKDTDIELNWIVECPNCHMAVCYGNELISLPHGKLACDYCQNIKPMVYKKERDIEVLHSGNYRGIYYYIISIGTHPCAYVNVPSINGQMLNILHAIVHGGITYQDSYLNVGNDREIKGNFIGWDYAHFGDYSTFFDDLGVITKELNKYTTEEIIDEIKIAIDFYHEYIKREKEKNEK